MKRNQLLATTGAALVVPLVPVSVKAYNPCKDVIVPKPLPWTIEFTGSCAGFKCTSFRKVLNGAHVFYYEFQTETVIEMITIKMQTPDAIVFSMYKFSPNGLHVKEKDTLAFLSPHSANEKEATSVFHFSNNSIPEWKRIAWIVR